MFDTLRKARQLIGSDRRARWIGVVLLAVVVSVFEATGAILVFGLIDLVTGGSEAVQLPLLGEVERWLPGESRQEMFWFAASFVSGFFLVRGVLLFAQGYLVARVAENAGATLAARLLRGYLHTPYSLHVRRSSSELIRNTYDSVQVFTNEVLYAGVRLVSDLLMVLGILAVLVMTNVLATVLAFFILGPMVLFLVRTVHPRVQKLGVSNQEFSQSSLQSLQQSLGAWRDIKVLGRESFFEREFARSRYRLARVRYLQRALRAAPRVVIETAVILLIVGFLVFTMANEGSFSGALPVLGLFGYAALRLQPTLNSAFESLNHLRFADAVVGDLHRDVSASEEFLATRSRVSEIEPLPLNEELRLQGVSFRYEDADAPALHGIELSLRPGEALGVVGPSGGGKSTLTDLILGLLEPTTGTVTIDGVDLRGHSEAWHANIGMVSQEVYLVDDTLRRNVALGTRDEEIDEQQVVDAIRAAQLDDYVAGLEEGLDARVGERGVRLSGGQRQRVAIARALYRRPSVLILDEGTAALDSVTEADFIRTLRERDRSTTLILVTHRIAAVRFCNRIAVIDNGQIVALGSFAHLERTSVPFQALLRAGTD